MSLENIFPETLLIHENCNTEVIHRDSIKSFRVIVAKDSRLIMEIHYKHFNDSYSMDFQLGEVLEINTHACNIYVGDFKFGKLDIRDDRVTLLDDRYQTLEPEVKFALKFKSDFYKRLFFEYVKLAVKCFPTTEALIFVHSDVHRSKTIV